MCSKDKRHARTCVHCHREWQAKDARARYCSTRCQYLASGSRVMLACQSCGRDFECKAMEMRAGRRFCSRECMLGVRRRPTKPCPECGTAFAPRRRTDTSKGKGIYCSKKCAGAARRAGKRDGRWKEAAELRACRAKIKPSQKMYAAIQDSMRKHMEGIARLYRLLNSYRPCLHCGGPLKEHATDNTKFCSIACSARYEWQCQCSHCGQSFPKRGVHGSTKSSCAACKAKAKRHYRKYNNIAKRAIKHGVERVKYSRTELLDRDHWACQLCGVTLLRSWKYHKHTLIPHPRNATIDHIVSMANGGADAPWNIQACCFRCNTRKSKKNKGQLRFTL